MFLYWLAHAASYKVVASAFNIPKSTVHRVVHRVVHKVSRAILGLLKYMCSSRLYVTTEESSWTSVSAFLDLSMMQGPSRTAIYSRQLYPAVGQCILGDGGYPCLTSPITIMTPYREPVASPVAARYNRHHPRASCWQCAS